MVLPTTELLLRNRLDRAMFHPRPRPPSVLPDCFNKLFLSSTGNLIDDLVPLVALAGDAQVAPAASPAVAAALNLLPRAPPWPLLVSATLAPDTIIAILGRLSLTPGHRSTPHRGDGARGRYRSRMSMRPAGRW
jgi:hypothetical protein